MNFDDRLRSALTHDPLPVVPPGFVDDIVDALPRARGGPAQRVRALGFTVAVVIAVSVGVWVVGPSGWLVGPAASPTSGTGTASAPASASPTEATPGLGAWTHLAWQDVSPAFGGSSGPIVTGTSSSGGYVLVGGNGFPGSTIWYSADGLAWRRGVESDGGEFQGMSFVGVAAGGGNLVAIAQLEGALTPTRVRPTLVWHSTDGVVWFPSPEPPDLFGGLSVHGIAGGSDGFVIYGTNLSGQSVRPAMLYSHDGVTWTEAAVPDGVVGQAVSSVVATVEGFAAVGGPATGAAGSGAAWWSPDGQTWQSGSVESSFGLEHLVRWAGGELRASSSDRAPCSVCLGIPGTITWSSTDGGRSWRSIGDSAVLPNGDTTIYDTGRVVRLQTQGGTWATWSTDGVTWVPLRMDGASPTNASPCNVGPCSAWVLILANGDTLIATGSQPVASGGSRTEVLIGQLDDQPGPVPTPTLVPGSQDTPCKGTNPCGP